MGGCLVSLERKCPIWMSELKMKWDAPWVLPGGPYLFWVLTPGTDITTIMEFYSLAEEFVKSERAAKHFVLRIDYFSLLLHKVTARAFWSSSTFTLFTEHNKMEYNYMCLSLLPALAWVKTKSHIIHLKRLHGQYINWKLHPTSHIRFWRHHYETLCLCPVMWLMFINLQHSPPRLHCSKVSALPDGMLYSAASHSHLLIPPHNP